MFKDKQDELVKLLEEQIVAIDIRHIKELINEALIERNVQSSTIVLVSQILSQRAKLETLIDGVDFRLLYFFAVAFENATKRNLDVRSYFTKIEVQEYENFKYSEQKEMSNVLVFENVNVINDHHFKTVISGRRMYELDNAKKLIWNPNTQRNPKITKHGSKINIFPSKIDAIYEELKNDTYEPDEIIINVLKTGDEKIRYNEKTKTLMVEGIINLLDGMHRKEANTKICAEDSNFDMFWGLTILNVSEPKALDVIIQKNKQTKIAEAFLSTRDSTKPENNVLSIMEDERCELFKVIGDSEKEIINGFKLTKKSIIADAIKDIYENEINDKYDRRQTAKWLTEFFDYFLLKQCNKEFIVNPRETKEVSFINHKNMFYAFISLSKTLREVDDWENELKNRMEMIDFSKNNPLWIKIGLLSKRDANVKLKGELYDLFN